MGLRIKAVISTALIVIYKFNNTAFNSWVEIAVQKILDSIFEIKLYDLSFRDRVKR